MRLLLIALFALAGCGTGDNGAACRTIKYEGRAFQECRLPNGSFTCTELGQSYVTYDRCHFDEESDEETDDRAGEYKP